jgi:lactate dehydrogenase-like 2-hydroxyacid dehydrogenase
LFASIAVSTDLQADFVQRVANEFTIAAKFNPVDQSVSWNDGKGPVTALIVPSIVPVTAAAIAALPGLGLICCFGAGFDGVNLVAVRERGIVVTHSPGANAGAVAELAFGLLLAITRDIAGHDRFARSGRWLSEPPAWTMPMPRGLRGSKLGILGLGTVGVGIAQCAEAFGMQVGYHNPKPRADTAYDYLPSVLALAKWADFLVVSARADGGSDKIVDLAVLEALGSGGYLVNVARGSLVDENALIEALEKGIIAGAALDVFAREPAIPARLTAQNNIVLSPHVAGRTRQAYYAMGQMVLNNLSAFVAGRTPPNIIPPLANRSQPV